MLDLVPGGVYRACCDAQKNLNNWRLKSHVSITQRLQQIETEVAWTPLLARPPAGASHSPGEEIATWWRAEHIADRDMAVALAGDNT
jgi:hypothetical protein